MTATTSAPAERVALMLRLAVSVDTGPAGCCRRGRHEGAMSPPNARGWRICVACWRDAHLAERADIRADPVKAERERERRSYAADPERAARTSAAVAARYHARRDALAAGASAELARIAGAMAYRETRDRLARAGDVAP